MSEVTGYGGFAHRPIGRVAVVWNRSGAGSVQGT
jgi:hypothetical protein